MTVLFGEPLEDLPGQSADKQLQGHYHGKADPERPLDHGQAGFDGAQAAEHRLKDRTAGLSYNLVRRETKRTTL